MKIIDFERKGNLVRFYLGDSPDYCGDDWDDVPYEHNAGRVYDNFILCTKDIIFPFDDEVLEPNDGFWSKNDMKERHLPCIIVVPHKLIKDKEILDISFSRWVGDDRIIKYYFGDELI